MSIDGSNVMWIIAGGASVSTFLFWGSFYLGQLWHELKSLRERVDGAERNIAELQLRRSTDRFILKDHQPT